MNNFSRKFKIVFIGILVLGSLVSAQDFWRRSRRRDRANVGRNGVPMWENDTSFKSDTFTFVRIRYNTHYGDYKWDTDYPDADLNLSFRLQELTSIKTDPNLSLIHI